MELDFFRKRVNDTIPSCGDDRLKCFSMSKKFTRLTNGMNKWKTMPHYLRYKEPNSGYIDVYGIIAKENKKRYALLPFID